MPDNILESIRICRFYSFGGALNLFNTATKFSAGIFQPLFCLIDEGGDRIHHMLRTAFKEGEI
jgi:hypothetical protein